MQFWFWTDIVSPHQVALYRGLGDLGHEVKVFVDRVHPTEDRLQLGWEAEHSGLDVTPLIGRAHAMSIVAAAPGAVIHICSGLHARHLFGHARQELDLTGRVHWAMLEKVDDHGWRRPLKRLYYRYLLRRWHHLGGILAIGGGTREWLIERGADPALVFPFAYFLDPPGRLNGRSSAARSFTICYVGNLSPGKRVDLLLRAAGSLDHDVNILIVGRGECEASLKRLAGNYRNLKVTFRPPVPRSKVFEILSAVDLLVQPSAADGWGAVISEALLVGTPVICSDACGAHVAAQASPTGWVFRRNDLGDLCRSLTAAIGRGPIQNSERERLASWARCLAGAAGANYLCEILEGGAHGQQPTPPWRKPHRRECVPR